MLNKYVLWTIIISSVALIKMTPLQAEAASPIYPRSAQEWTQALQPPAVKRTRVIQLEPKGLGAPAYQPKNLAIHQDPPVAANVLFEFDTATVRPHVNPDLDELGKALHDGLNNAVLVIEGHTDSIGSVTYNLQLSQRRATAVQMYLVTQHGVAQERLLTQGYGETQPIASNQTEAGREANRRVEFKRIR